MHAKRSHFCTESIVRAHREDCWKRFIYMAGTACRMAHHSLAESKGACEGGVKGGSGREGETRLFFGRPSVESSSAFHFGRLLGRA
jgi:hypothetical protein